MPAEEAGERSPVLDWLLRTRPLSALDLGLGFRGFHRFGRTAAEEEAREATALLSVLPGTSDDPAERRLRLLLSRAVRRVGAPLHGPEDPAAPVEDALLALIGCDLREGAESDRGQVLQALPAFLGEAAAELAQAHPPRAFLEMGIQLGSAAAGLLLARGDLEADGVLAARPASEAFSRYVEALSAMRSRATGDPSAGAAHLGAVLRAEAGTGRDPHRLMHLAEADLGEAFAQAQDAAQELSPGADWGEVLAGLGEDHPDDAAGLPGAYGDALHRVREAAQGVFPDAPVRPLSVRLAPAHLSHLVPFVGYLPPGLAEGSAGALLVAPAPGQLQEVHCRRRLPLHAAREGVPGNHLVHSVRGSSLAFRLALSPCFGQAWAEYAAERVAECIPDPGVHLLAALARARRAALAAADLGLQSGVRDPERVLRELSETLGLTGPAADHQFTQVARRPGESASVWWLARRILEETRARTAGGAPLPEAHRAVLVAWPFAEEE